jgi:uncharacterized protein (DUF924 family)
MGASEPWRDFHDWWFPPDLPGDDGPAHRARFMRWFGGGATEEMARFAAPLRQALTGELEDWAATPSGRLALIVLLDQGPRGLAAGGPGAFAGDPFALRHAEAALATGQYDALRWPWEKTFVVVATCHAEGPGHLARMDRAVALAERILRDSPEPWRPLYEHSARQAAAHRETIARFGRYPHRNAALGRASTPEEEAYIAAGDFVHQRRPPEVARG